MEYFYHSIWEKNGRALNEDALCLYHATKKGKNYLLAVVCDGIGGLPEGENASTFVADSMRKELIKQLENPKHRNIRKRRNLFLQRIYQCHRELTAYGKERQIQLGTTITMLFLYENQGYLFQAGDSALFSGKQRGGAGEFENGFTGLKRVSSIHRTKNGALKQAVGAGKTLQVEWKYLKVGRGSVWLLVSDGFYQKIEKELVNRPSLRGRRLKKNKKNGRGEQAERREEVEKEMALLLQQWYQRAVYLGERDNASAIGIVCK